MLFNSFEYAWFLLIVFIIYWFILNKRHTFQNLFLLFASYVFYAWWDWRFLSLIIISSITDYTVGMMIEKNREKQKKKYWLWGSIAINIGLLGTFKYYNFFAENLVWAFSSLGVSLNMSSLQIILPVGISFYTFQTLSYTLDIYKGKIKPTKDIIAFLAYVGFFPQLIAGPIERASHLLPQFLQKRTFDYNKATSGLRYILWGLFKKIVIADNCATYVNYAFSDPESQTGSTLLLATFYFAFQIYGDFSGYSDIAIGTGRLLGFKLTRNFAYPYFSRNIAEFWRRWHISLTSWFRDYIYIPLGGSREGTFRHIRNIFIIFIITGFWHGANWTFIFWGALNAIYYAPLIFIKRYKKYNTIVAENRLFPSIKEFFQILITFSLTLFAWIFFRASNITEAFSIVEKIFSSSIFLAPKESKYYILIIILILFEWSQRNQENVLNYQISRHKIFRWAAYIFILLMIIIFYPSSNLCFIYFQF